MFRVVTDFVPKPKFFFLCDRPHCNELIQAEVRPGFEHALESQAEFAKTAIAVGWKLNLEEHVCPKHVKLDRDAQARVQPVANFGKVVLVNRK